MAESNLPADPSALLGKKLSILYRIEDPEHPFSEAVGMLQSFRDGLMTIARKDGTTRVIPIEDILRMKVVPTGRGRPRPPASWET